MITLSLSSTAGSVITVFRARHGDAAFRERESGASRLLETVRNCRFLRSLHRAEKLLRYLTTNRTRPPRGTCPGRPSTHQLIAWVKTLGSGIRRSGRIR